MKKYVITIAILLFCALLMSCSTPIPVVDLSNNESTPLTETPTATPESTEVQRPTENPTPTPAKASTATPEPTDAQHSTVFGKMQDGIYINEMLGITAAFPEGWEAADEEELIATNGGTSDLYYDFESVFGYINSVVIAQCAKPNTNNDDQSFSITVGVENTTWTPEYKEQSIKSLVSIMESVDKAVGSTTQISEGDDLELHGTKYNHIHIETVFEKKAIYQEQFVTGINEYILMITCAYTDEYKKNAGETISNFLESIKYNQ